MTKDELTALKVPEDLHEDPTLKEIKDIPTALKVLVDTKAFVGRSIRIPSENASEDERKSFRDDLKKKIPNLVELPADPTELEKVEGSIFERLGRPADEKGYPGVKEILKDLPEGVEVNEDELRSIGKKLGLTKKQHVEFVKGVVEERAKIVNLNTEAAKKLRTELGQAFDERLTAAAVAAQKLGATESTVAALRKGAVPAETARLWIGVAKALGTEAGDLSTPGGGPRGKLTPSEAQLQIAELYRNPAMKDAQAPGHDALVLKLHELTTLAYPEE